MLLVCKNHIKDGLGYLHTPHVTAIKDQTFMGRCVFCDRVAKYKLFYSIPISKSHRVRVKENLLKRNATS